MNTEHTPKLKVYLIPGMSAGAESFEALSIPKNCTSEVLPWLVPKPQEALIDYAKRMLSPVDTTAPFILLGVSFGGIVAQEALHFLKPEALVLISTVKSSAEKPKWMRWMSRTNMHKILPYYIAAHLSDKPWRMLPGHWHKRLKQYDYYLPMRDPIYLSWGVDQVLKWKGVTSNSDVPVVHIHGDSDDLFPLRHIKGAHVIKGGPHIMILTHGKAVGKLLEFVFRKFN